MSSEENKRGLSITTITIFVGVVVAWLLWGVSCAMYRAAQPETAEGDIEVVVDVDKDHLTPSRVRGAGPAFIIAGVATFFIKTITMLPELPSVLAFLFRERLWFVVVATGIIAGVIFFGVYMKRLELALASSKKRKRKKYKPAL